MTLVQHKHHEVGIPDASQAGHSGRLWGSGKLFGATDGVIEGSERPQQRLKSLNPEMSELKKKFMRSSAPNKGGGLWVDMWVEVETPMKTIL